MTVNYDSKFPHHRIAEELKGCSFIKIFLQHHDITK